MQGEGGGKLCSPSYFVNGGSCDIYIEVLSFIVIMPVVIMR